MKTLRTVLAELNDYLKLLGYSDSTLRQFGNTWAKLQTYHDDRGLQALNRQSCADFLIEVCEINNPCTKDKNLKRRAVEQLLFFEQNGKIPRRLQSKQYVFKGKIAAPILEYLDFRKSVVCDKMIKSDKIYLERIGLYLYSNGADDLGGFTVNDIHGFVKTLTTKSKPTIYRTLVCFKQFLRFAYEKGYTDKDYSFNIPKIAYLRTSTIPSAFDTDEVQRLIAQVDRGNPAGKRDYAILLLAARLGMRASDISALSFMNLRWEENIIEIELVKGDKPTRFPLLNDVGDAIIDYLRYGRPKSTIENVFLSHRTPVNIFTGQSIHRIVTEYLQKAGVHIPKGKHHGSHALRHSLASTMLENNESIYTIKEVLDHESVNTTMIYLKINITQLKNCALPILPVGIGKGRENNG